MARLWRRSAYALTVGISWGNVRSPHSVIILGRYRESPIWQVLDYQEISAAKDPVRWLRKLRQQLEKLLESHKAERLDVTVDASTGGSQCLRTVRANLSWAAVYPTGLRVTAGDAASPGTWGRGLLIESISSLLSVGDLRSHRELSDNLAQFGVKPVSESQAKDETAWRVDNSECAGYAMVALYPWRTVIVHDLAARERERLGQHPLCRVDRGGRPSSRQGAYCCQGCPDCATAHAAQPRAAMLTIRSQAPLCAWCRDLAEVSPNVGMTVFNPATSGRRIERKSTVDYLQRLQSDPGPKMVSSLDQVIRDAERGQRDGRPRIQRQRTY